MSDVVDLNGWKARERGPRLRTIYRCSDCDSHAFKLTCTKEDGAEWGPITVECANCERPHTFRVELTD